MKRQSRYTTLVHLPNDHGVVAVREGLVRTINALRKHLRKSLTWDPGTELTITRKSPW
ncbi:hypothetical protein [Arthrobacter cryoconiti]|uniref:hypothetical protein n=1 Tax=Arthrobacter cryoconiti TaxID=748907 RepID=UPI001E4A85F1|nr:hypothetical protein [Arthrobacter cryoconiti]MCC9067776.1 hypothetical protein [Arthrobacter cryoconiti]